MQALVRPTKRLRAMLGTLGTPREIKAAIEDSVAVDALARLLTEQIERNTKPGGRVDMLDVAAAVLAELGRNQVR